MSDGGITSTPFSSANTASPGVTGTPPQEIGTQNSPPMKRGLQVIGDRPRAQTGMA